jgi:hypothetical protein
MRHLPYREAPIRFHQFGSSSANRCGRDPPLVRVQVGDAIDDNVLEPEPAAGRALKNRCGSVLWRGGYCPEMKPGMKTVRGC